MKTLAFLLSLLICSGLSAQSLRFTGTVADAVTGEPLAFAQVRALKAGFGTLSNEDGAFVLQLPQKLPGDSLRISYIGYQSLKLPLAKLRMEQPLELALQPREVQLAEVLIVPISPEDLLRRAIAALPENYPPYGTNFQGFYREVGKVNEKYTISESVASYYRYPETTQASPQIEFEGGEGEISGDVEGEAQLRVIKGRNRTDSTSWKDVGLKELGGGSSLAGLPVRGLGISPHFLIEDHFKLYDYHLLGISTYQERPVYVIRFDQKKRLRNKLYTGTIFLDLRTLAFAAIEYRFSEEGKKFRLDPLTNLGQKMILGLAKLWGYRWDLSEHSGRMDYTFRDGYWYLNYVRQHLTGWGATPKKKGQRETYHFDVDLFLVVTQLQPGPGQPFPEQPKDTTKTAENAPVTYDEAFWANYNYLKPSGSLQGIAEEIGER
jgi:hypothetical protein